MVENNQEFRRILKEKFIFCYSPKVMNYLRHRGCRYICKSNHEITNAPFWLYLRTLAVEALMAEYNESLTRELPEVEGF